MAQLTIYVQDDLRKELTENQKSSADKRINISEICQKALREALRSVKNAN